jgi:hypothetical protein
MAPTATGGVHIRAVTYTFDPTLVFGLLDEMFAIAMVLTVVAFAPNRG